MTVSFIRSIILYIFLIFAVRMMGKRQIGQLEPSEFVVTMLLADLAAVPVQDPGIPLLSGIIPILTVMMLEIFLSVLSYQFIGIRKLLCGSPVLLMDHGEILYENMKKTRLTPEELIEQLREKDIFDLSIIKYAILETNGQISALIDSSCKPPVAKALGVCTPATGLPYTLVTCGKICTEPLNRNPRTEEWIRLQLKKENCNLQDVILFTEDETGTCYLSKKEGKE